MRRIRCNRNMLLCETLQNPVVEQSRAQWHTCTHTHTRTLFLLTRAHFDSHSRNGLVRSGTHAIDISKLTG